uniref:Secreted protein n=1 Tax=Steinernema glaseri TaxID=37863 RepID=A0A1I8AR44_9BILA
MSGITLCIYIILLASLVKQRLKMKSQNQAGMRKLTVLWKDKSILIYAISKFCVDNTISLNYYLPTTFGMELTGVYWHHSVRHDVFPFLKAKKIVAVVAATTKC